MPFSPIRYLCRPRTLLLRLRAANTLKLTNLPGTASQTRAGNRATGGGSDVRVGANSEVGARNRHVRFSPIAIKLRTSREVRFVPQTDSCIAARKIIYSITSSALVSSVVGIVRPSALAVLRLITSSNLVGCSTGRSEGLVPLRILST
jgi:hypothetical protein